MTKLTHTLLTLAMLWLGMSYAFAQNEFITTWKTDNPGTSNDNQITLPILAGGGSYNYDVDWGDGNSDLGVTSDAAFTHTYDSPGTYTVTITGTFPRFYFNNGEDREKLLTVEQWGNIAWNALSFFGCTNLTVNATDSPNLSATTSLGNMFRNCTSFNSNINHWNTSNIQFMQYTFMGATAFNQPLNNWDVSNVTSMISMFQSASDFNQDIGNWNVGNVTNMQGMFYGAYAFNQDLNDWNVGNVTNMQSMFDNAQSFNGNISNWDVSSVTTMRNLFLNSEFNQDIGNWNVGNVTNMTQMFRGTPFNQDVSNWNVSNVTDMVGTFQSCPFNFPLNDWDVSSVTITHSMFSGNTVFNQPLDNWDVSSVTNMGSMFRSASSFNQDISNWSTSKVTEMGLMFWFATDFNQNIGNWDVSSTANMLSMLQGASSFDQNLGTWDISNVTTMTSMLNNSGITTTNYDNTLKGWSAQTVQTGVTLNAQGLFFCNASAERDDLINIHGWTIVDAGQQCLPFVTTWITTEGTITIPTTTGTYNYDVTWNNLTNPGVNEGSTSGETGDYTITGLENNSTYQIEISGDFPRIYINGGAESDKIVSIEQWGNIEWTSMEFAFASSPNLVVNATDAPNLSNATTLRYMFSNCDALTNEDFSHWDVSTITNMFAMFYNANNFNGNVSNWDVSNVINMQALFGNGTNFNGDVSAWDVSNVTVMKDLFYGASSFNQDISSWNTASVQTMRDMFNGASSFNQDISEWITGSVTNMIGMFAGATSFNQNLGNWDIADVTDMTNMLNSSDLSTYNYDKTLIGWAAQTVQTGVNFGASGLQYCNGAAAVLTLTDGGGANWDINDAGENCVIDFPDSNFKAALIADGIDNNPIDGDITIQEAEAVSGLLDVNNAAITDITGIEYFSNVTDLRIQDNDITSIDLSNNPGLTSLTAWNNQFSTIDLSNNNLLTVLQLQNNLLTEIDVSNNPDLINLYIDGNDISEVDLSENPDLTRLNVSNNTAMSALDISNNPLIEVLILIGTNISEVDFSLVPNLEDLRVYNSPITTIDLSDNPAVYYLQLGGNLLESIDLRNGTNDIITTIGFASSPNLSCVSVDNPAYSRNNWTIDDPSLFKFTCNPDDIVNIPDVNFKAALLINSSLNTTDDGEITYGEAEAFTGTIDVNNQNIDDLTGIEAFVNLTRLSIWSNNLTSLDVSNNTKLTYLHAGYNSIGSLDMTYNSALTDFRCQSNNLSSIDVSMLAELDIFICGNNNLTTLDVSNNTKLSTQFSCDGNQLTSLDLSNNPLIKRLYVQNNDITSLDLSNHPNLDDVYLINNELTELDMRNGGNEGVNTFNVTGNTNLTCISVDNPKYTAANWTDIPVGAEFKFSCDPNDIVNIPDANFKAELLADGSINTTDDGEITYGEATAFTGTLQAVAANITDVTGLEAFENVIGIYLSGNPSLSNIDLSYNTALEHLEFSNCNVSTIDLSNNTSLRILRGYDNNLTSLDVSLLADLTELSIRGNNLTSIDVSSNPDLQNLYIHSNDISSLDVTNNTLLTTLLCDNNNIGVIDLSNNPNLQELRANGNSLVSIDVSSNSVLTKLNVHTNLLTELNVANGNNTNFTIFEADNNSNLTCITVDDVAYSEANWTNIDNTANYSTDCSNVANDITAFSLAEQVSAATIGTGTIDIEVTLGTDLSSLTPTFTVSTGATADPASGVAQDFSSAFNYTVTAENPTAIQEWTVNVMEENVAPTDIGIDNASISELNAINDVIGALSSADANNGASHTYSLVAGTGDTDNASFNIAGSNLVAAEVFDFETKSSYSVRIQTDDGRGGTFAKEFTISITNVSGAEQAITFDALTPVTTGDDAFELTATASSGLTVTYASSNTSVATISGITVTIVGAGTTTIMASQSGNEDYAAAVDVSQDLVVNKLDQTITFDALSGVFYGDADFNLAATASSGLDVTYTSSDESVATISGSTVTIVGAGTASITAAQAGNATYNPATDVTQTLEVFKAIQTITFDAVTEVNVDDPAFELSATASSGLVVSFTSSDETVATVNGTTVTIVGEGTTTLTATQEGDTNYEAATPVIQELLVNPSPKSEQTITFDAIEDQFIEEGTLTLSATASSGLEVSYEILSGPATVAGNVVTFTDLGTVTVAASQVGNDDFFPAVAVEQTFEVITVTSLSTNAKDVVRFYPNPTTDKLYFEFGSLEVKQIQLLDLNGKEVSQKADDFREMDIQHLKSGNYILRILTDTEVITNQIVKQ